MVCIAFTKESSADIRKQLIPSLFLFASAGSDKCGGESDCISFDDHMKVVADFWSQHVNETGIESNPTVIFTTEDKIMMDEQKAWVDQNGPTQSRFAFEFVLNGRDILPGSGFIREVGKVKVPSHLELSQASSSAFSPELY